MAVRATYVAQGLPGTDFVVGPYMGAVDQAIVDEVWQACRAGTLECREHDDDLRLAHLRGPDGRVHGAWVHIRKNPAKTKWVIAHSRNSELPVQFRSHVVSVNESPEHRWAKDYFCRAAQDGGFTAEQEFVLPNTRLDVRIEGALGPVGVEMQRAGDGVPAVRGRHRKAANAGIPLAWAAEFKGPDWAFKVPHFEANDPLPHGDVPRGSWNVTTGTRRLITVSCTCRNSDLLPRCWKRRSGWCGGSHAIFRPIRGLVVDDVIQQFAAGELVALDTRPHKQGIVLVRRGDHDLWVAEFAPQLPSRTTRKKNSASLCAYSMALNQVERHAEPPDEPSVFQVPTAPNTCMRCQEPKWAMADGYCFSCRWDLGMSAGLAGGSAA